MNTQVSESDRLRLPSQVYAPDPRQSYIVKVDQETGLHRKIAIEDQYEAISRYILNSCVPVDIGTHFETARNLYLYAWFVYRFYSVAEQQVIASLEFALRERFPDFVAAEKKKHPKGFEPGIKKLLKFAISDGIVANERLLARERWARISAEKSYSLQKMLEAQKAGLDSWVEDPSEIVVTDEDLNHDWLGAFCEYIPTIRNSYAHGSAHLYPSPVGRTFEFVAEIINQLYPLKSDNSAP